MSVINRMLADLEQRGAPAARGAGALHSPASARRPRRDRRTIGSLLLLVPLAAVAIALWLPPGTIALPNLIAASGAPAPPAPDREDPGSVPGPMPTRGAARDDPAARVTAAPASATQVRAAPPVHAAAPPPVAAPSAAKANADAQHPPSPRIDSGLAADARARAADTPAAAATRAAGSSYVAPSGAGTSGTAATPAAASAGTPPVSASSAPAGPVASASSTGLIDKRPAGTPPVAGAQLPAPQAAGAVNKQERSSAAVRAERRYAAARELIARRDSVAARRNLRAALALDPQHHGARDLLVALLRRIGELAEARELLARGLELAPGRAGFATPYARLLVDAGDLERAAAVLASAGASGAGDAEYHALAAAIAQQRGEHHEAVAQYTQAIETQVGGQGRLWLGLGISLAANGRDADAQRAFRTALASGDLPARLHDWARSRIE